MLILSRRNGESIIIGDEVTITILQTKGGHVKIGIDAPREIAVHREEVYQRLAQDLPQSCAPIQLPQAEPVFESDSVRKKELA